MSSFHQARAHAARTGLYSCSAKGASPRSVDDHDLRALPVGALDHESTFHDVGLEPRGPLRHSADLDLGHAPLLDAQVGVACERDVSVPSLGKGRHGGTWRADRSTRCRRSLCHQWKTIRGTNRLRGRVIDVAMAFRLVLGRFAVFQVTAVIHPVVEHANDKNARFVRFEEDAVTATGGHLQPGSEVVTIAGQYTAPNEPLQRVSDRPHIPRCSILTPCPD